jgi:diaminopimelate epimerase
MIIHFEKYQGTGNDFILIDNRRGELEPIKNRESIANLCHRRFGIGADGLILLENSHTADFRMVYYNADGAQSTMCGNGGRCIAAFAKKLGAIQDTGTFEAIDGLHRAIIHGEVVEISMNDPIIKEINPDHCILDTGSPHIVQLFHENIHDIDVKTAGRDVRNSDKFRADGINVNFMNVREDEIFLRTYERGVEEETLSCGTGVTAAAISYSLWKDLQGSVIQKIHTPGGLLEVSFSKQGNDISHVRLKGPVKFVFSGRIEIR